MKITGLQLALGKLAWVAQKMDPKVGVFFEPELELSGDSKQLGYISKCTKAHA